MATKVLVIGGTGMLGAPVARRLRADGYQVRIFTRNLDKARAKFGAEYEVVAGDVEDQPSLLAALQGCQAVHVNLDGGLDPDLERRGAENVARAAARTGVQRITLLSGTSVKAGELLVRRDQGQVRGGGRGSGIGRALHHLPGDLLHGDVAPFRARHARQHPRQPAASLALGRGRRLRPHGLQSLRDAGGGQQDAARFRAATLDNAPGAANLLQPSPARMPRSARSPSGWRRLIAGLSRDKELEAVLPFFRYSEKVAEAGDPAEANALLGAPTTTLEQWCKLQVGRK